MCGILGVYDETGFTDDVIINSLSKMHYRGPDHRGYERYNPDGAGELVLGHTRLSIIDLSAAGHQPMSTIDGRLALSLMVRFIIICKFVKNFSRVE